jgi:hypothetical protein
MTTDRYRTMAAAVGEGRTSLADRIAAHRRDLLAAVDALAETLSTPGAAAAEGIDTAELDALRAAGLRLAAAADARTRDTDPEARP